MSEKLKKQFGLILKTKETKPATLTNTNVFGDLDDDDDVEKVDTSYSKSSASTIRVMKHAERQHEAALAADSSIFDYDGSFEEMQAIKDAKIAEQKKKDNMRKSKYAEDIHKAHKRREIEKHSREERQQQKERVKEGEEFADKEKFVTGAYREQQEMVQKFREEEAYEQRFNELTSVEKQKLWQAGLSRQLLDDLSRDGNAPKAVQNEPPKKERHIRKRLNSDSESDGEKKEQEKPKKSIYSDDEEGPAFVPPKKNFEGELKPGLNKVARRPSPRSGRAETKHDRIKNKMFTPSPEPSDDEEDRRRDSRRDRREESPSDRRRDERKDEKKSERKEEEKKKEKPVVVKKKTDEEIKAERLLGLKEILKQRNGPQEIEEARKRYLERRDTNFVPLPL